MERVSLKGRRLTEDLNSLLDIHIVADVARHGRMRWFGYREHKSEDDWLLACTVPFSFFFSFEGEGRWQGSGFYFIYFSYSVSYFSRVLGRFGTIQYYISFLSGCQLDKTKFSLVVARLQCIFLVSQFELVLMIYIM